MNIDKFRDFMCEIFCFNSSVQRQINEYLKCFYSHSDEHPHGWGLAIMDSDDYFIDKEPVKASESEHLKDILSDPIVGEHIFAHIRLATVGEVKLCNCHPFIKYDNNERLWILMHNGTIFDFPELDSYDDAEKGDTDSEKILLYLIDQINESEKVKGGSLSVEERFELVSGLLTNLSKGNKLNIMIFDGELMYVHTNFRESLYYLKTDDSIFVASSPLCDKTWKPVELNTIFGLIDGKVRFQSKTHDWEFVFTDEHIEYFESLNQSH